VIEVDELEEVEEPEPTEATGGQDANAWEEVQAEAASDMLGPEQPKPGQKKGWWPFGKDKQKQEEAPPAEAEEPVVELEPDQPAEPSIAPPPAKPAAKPAEPSDDDDLNQFLRGLQ